jgi:hypothetical protein
MSKLTRTAVVLMAALLVGPLTAGLAVAQAPSGAVGPTVVGEVEAMPEAPAKSGSTSSGSDLGLLLLVGGVGALLWLANNQKRKHPPIYGPLPSFGPRRELLPGMYMVLGVVALLIVWLVTR